ncbi:tetratricopeptide repeat protein [Planococcus sp. ISL-109]|uniref:tetratricopeptide repeat protein n=1 Tax=Planococcus sp. ISL-109 TaxID=2819166 RepID=UPI001BEBA303|nr:tetratricopeptide repeat protein [Planococcus sp. ISL-109]MBT2582450.1 tetratricopeptide repeat protein [Planococcus sp. ISL-109]
MRKKFGDLKRRGNVIVFPTTVTRLLTEGMTNLKNEQYEDARDKLYQVLVYEPEHAAALGGYAYSLYELGEFTEALEVVKELLRIGPIHYLETMELYISILMQVKEFQEAEKMIEVLIEENVLPAERLEQFHQLRDLNERIAESNTTFKKDVERYALDQFLLLSPVEQEQRVTELPKEAYAAMCDQLQQLIAHPEVDWVAKSYLLLMLREQQLSGSVHVEKFHYTQEFTVETLPDPLKDKRLLNIRLLLERGLEKEPAKLQMAMELVDRHIYLLYPFFWEDFDEAEIADAYHLYLDSLFSGETADQANPELMNLLKQAEAYIELRNG